MLYASGLFSTHGFADRKASITALDRFVLRRIENYFAVEMHYLGAAI